MASYRLNCKPWHERVGATRSLLANDRYPGDTSQLDLFDRDGPQPF